MKTFSVAEQSVTELDSGIGITFGPSTDDASVVCCTVTHGDDTVSMSFNRNGLLLNVHAVKPEADKPVEPEPRPALEPIETFKSRKDSKAQLDDAVYRGNPHG